MKISKRYFRIYTWVSIIAVFAMLVSACAPQAADEPPSLAALIAVGQTATAVQAASASVNGSSNSIAAEPNAVIVDASFVSDAQMAALDVQASTVNTLAMAPQTSGVQTSKLSNTSSDAAALAAAPAQISQLAWFPKPPADKNLDTLAANFDVFILTHKDEPTRDALRAKGVTAPIFQYLRFEAIHDPGSCTATPRGNQAAYLPGDFCDISTNHSDWFLLDSAGKRIKFATDTVTYYRMNPGSQGWREFYARRAGEMKKQFGWDGLFMDHSITGLSTKADIEGFFSYVRNNYS
ncbi:MAG: putative glycoside hydrolase [Chloroflexota bacterium]